MRTKLVAHDCHYIGPQTGWPHTAFPTPSLPPLSFSTFLKIWAWPSSPVHGAPHAKIFLDFGKGAQHYLPVFLFPWQIFSFFQLGK